MATKDFDYDYAEGAAVLNHGDRFSMETTYETLEELESLQSFALRATELVAYGHSEANQYPAEDPDVVPEEYGEALLREESVPDDPDAANVK